MTEPKFKRVFAIVLDSVGTGNAPDAAKFDDEGADTLGGHAWQGARFDSLNMIPDVTPNGIFAFTTN